MVVAARHRGLHRGVRRRLLGCRTGSGRLRWRPALLATGALLASRYADVGRGYPGSFPILPRVIDLLVPVRLARGRAAHARRRVVVARATARFFMLALFRERRGHR